MNWFVWRQYRKQFLVFGLTVAAFAAFTIPTGIHFWNSYQHALSTCHLFDSCNGLDGQVFGTSIAVFARDIMFAVGLFAPVLLGIFLGSPILAKEYDEGTNKLIWTQSVSRRKWLTIKLVWAVGFALLYGIVLTLLITWWSRTTDAIYQNRFSPGIFDIKGLMPIANSLLYTAIGFTLGAWFRKIVLAMAVTIGVFIAAQITFPNFIRPHYMTPVAVVSSVGPSKLSEDMPQGASWLLSKDIVDSKGKVSNAFGPESWPPQCQKLIQTDNAAAVKPDGPDAIDSCLDKAGYHQVVKYQPSYRYWDFQRIEMGIYLGMAALAVGATYWLVLRRDA